MEHLLPTAIISVIFFVTVILPIRQLIRTLREPTQENINRLDLFFFRRHKANHEKWPPTLGVALFHSIAYILVWSGITVISIIHIWKGQWS